MFELVLRMVLQLLEVLGVYAHSNMAQMLSSSRWWQNSRFWGELRHEIEKHSTALPQKQKRKDVFIQLWLYERMNLLRVMLKGPTVSQIKHHILFLQLMKFPSHLTTFKQHKHNPHETPFILTDNDCSSLCIWKQIKTERTDDNIDSKRNPCV